VDLDTTVSITINIITTTNVGEDVPLQLIVNGDSVSAIEDSSRGGVSVPMIRIHSVPEDATLIGTLIAETTPIASRLTQT